MKAVRLLLEMNDAALNCAQEVFSINLRMTEKGLFGKEKTNSFNILSKDRKFVSLLEKTKKIFDDGKNSINISIF